MTALPLPAGVVKLERRPVGWWHELFGGAREGSLFVTQFYGGQERFGVVVRRLPSPWMYEKEELLVALFDRRDAAERLARRVIARTRSGAA